MQEEEAAAPAKKKRLEPGIEQLPKTDGLLAPFATWPMLIVNAGNVHFRETTYTYVTSCSNERNIVL